MPDKPLVSIITATYNWSSVLRYAIQSALWQTFEDFEYLIIGDACTDDSEQVAASFNDPRIRWHNLAENSGSQSIPNNTGIEMARGTYIAYLGHDDVWHPTHLQVLVDALERSGEDFVYSMMEVFQHRGSEERALRGTIQWTSGNTPWIAPTCTMHRRDMVADTGLWRDYRTIEGPPDREFMMRAWEYGKKFKRVPELTAFKFPSANRKDAYITRDSAEQADIIRRIETEPDFRYRELIAIFIYTEQEKAKTEQPFEDLSIRWLFVREKHYLKRMVNTFKAWVSPLFAPLGWEVEQWREVRGLEARKLQRPGLTVMLSRIKRMLFGTSSSPS